MPERFKMSEPARGRMSARPSGECDETGVKALVGVVEKGMYFWSMPAGLEREWLCCGCWVLRVGGRGVYCCWLGGGMVGTVCGAEYVLVAVVEGRLAEGPPGWRVPGTLDEDSGWAAVVGVACCSWMLMGKSGPFLGVSMPDIALAAEDGGRWASDDGDSEGIVLCVGSSGWDEYS